MQTSSYNNIRVGESCYGKNHIQFADPKSGWMLDANLWHTSTEHPGIKLYKCKGKRLIVAVKDEEIFDAEIWDMYGSEYRYAQKAVEDRYK